MEKPFLAKFESFPKILENYNGTMITKTTECSDEDEYSPNLISSSTRLTESGECSDTDEYIQS